MRLRLSVGVVAMGFFLSLPAKATTFNFTKIADTNGSFNVFDGLPAINDGGTVAFRALLDENGEGIFTSSGGSMTTIADDSGPFYFSSGRAVPAFPFFTSINNEGTVAFAANLDAGGGGIFTSSGGPTTTIANTSSRFGFLGSPSINNGGTVAFEAGPTVALGSPLGGERGIFTGKGGLLTTIADNSGPFSNFFSNSSINDQGIVVFAAGLDEEGTGIFNNSGGQDTKIADTSGSLHLINSPSINNDGIVVFSASLDTGTEGILTGPNFLTDKVIATNESLSSLTVTELLFSREGLNNSGQVAFFARLSDGSSGIFRADPIPAIEPKPVPEASSALGILIAGPLGLIMMRKKRHRVIN